AHFALWFSSADAPWESERPLIALEVAFGRPPPREAARPLEAEPAKLCRPDVVSKQTHDAPCKVADVVRIDQLGRISADFGKRGVCQPVSTSCTLSISAATRAKASTSRSVFFLRWWFEMYRTYGSSTPKERRTFSRAASRSSGRNRAWSTP